VGTSVDRHRYLRKLREFYRLNKSLFPENVYYFLLIRRPVKDWQAVETNLISALASLTEARLNIPPLPPR
jgi:hypothetical protein